MHEMLPAMVLLALVVLRGTECDLQRAWHLLSPDVPKS